LWLSLLMFAAEVVVVIAWFVALFTARVPTGLASFLSSVLQYQARVYAYAYFLLTDVYPPFALEGSDYAVNVATNPGELNRAAVLFRFILMVPGYFVSFLTMVGAGIAMTVGWLITLILGRLPTPLWEANAAVLRYSTRFFGFSGLLSAEQPKGLFGDKHAPDEVPASELDLPERPRIRRLVLSNAARRLIVTFIAVAVLIYGGLFTVGVINGLKTSAAFNRLDESHHSLLVAVNDRLAAVQQCAATSGGLPCLHDADARAAAAFDRFADDVQRISFPSTIDASELIADAHDCANALRQMAAAETPAAYGALANEFQAAANEFDSDYSDFAYDVDYNT
jgi:hypothetical protein